MRFYIIFLYCRIVAYQVFVKIICYANLGEIILHIDLHYNPKYFSGQEYFDWFNFTHIVIMKASHCTSH